MIDRITIYINDVDLEDIEDCLSLIPAGIARDKSFKYSSTLNNLKISYAGRQLRISGSLHKYAKGNNFSLFTYDEAKKVLIELEGIVGIPLERFIVSNIELGLNLEMDKEVMEFLSIFHSYKSHDFIPMTPLKGSSKIHGRKCVLSEYIIKVYDKTFESKRNAHIRSAEIPTNLLRYEIQLSRKNLKALGFTNVTGKNLLSPLHYTRFKRLMKNIFDKIVFDETLDYTGCLEEDIKKHIFILSNKYNYYLQCVKEYFGEEEYRKERRRTNALVKRMSLLPTKGLETELKSKFNIEISKV